LRQRLDRKKRAPNNNRSLYKIEHSNQILSASLPPAAATPQEHRRFLHGMACSGAALNQNKTPRQLGWPTCTFRAFTNLIRICFARIHDRALHFGPRISYPSRCSVTLRLVRAPHAFAAPTVSAMTAPRVPSGLSGPTVESRAVWCSISELSSAPTSTTMVDSHIHIINPTTAPSAP